MASDEGVIRTRREEMSDAYNDTKAAAHQLQQALKSGNERDAQRVAEIAQEVADNAAEYMLLAEEKTRLGNERDKSSHDESNDVGRNM
ncbi:hypothetical protein AAVH_14237 [Aphelenchoides avenae]|nr:hypothetical protein AAVH_14237 [Aphelenchus avenae]